MTAEHIAVIQGVTATASLASSLFFFKFWSRTRDALFWYFGAAFILLALSWYLLAFISPASEAHSSIYAIRLIAFLLMIAAMIEKKTGSCNRKPPPGTPVLTAGISAVEGIP